MLEVTDDETVQVRGNLIFITVNISRSNLYTSSLTIPYNYSWTLFTNSNISNPTTNTYGDLFYQYSTYSYMYTLG